MTCPFILSPAASVVAGLTEPGGPRHPRRPPTWMVKGEGRIAFLPLAVLASFARTHFRAGEESRAKDAKDAKVKGKKDEEIAGVVEEGAFALRIHMPCA